MSSDNDRCFQCQEISHMACYCPHIQCYDCDNYGHVAMDCPDKIPPSGTPAHCIRVMPTTGMIDRPLDVIAKPDCSHCDYKDRSRFSCSWSCSHNHRYRSSSHHDSHRSHSRSFHRPSHHVVSLHHRSSSSYHYCCNTLHCRSSSHRNPSRDDSRSQHKS